jgi:hypothetical protein
MVTQKLILFLLLSLSVYGDLQYLTRSITTQTAFESTNKRWWYPRDDTSKRVNIGFDFPFNGNSYNKIRINTNGALTFGSNGYFDYKNQALSYKELSIYPYWYDFNPERGGSIRYGNLGTGDDKRLVITWQDLPRYKNSNNYSVQVVLYADGSIRFRYDSSTDAWSEVNSTGCSRHNWTCKGATIGVEEDSSHYDEYSYNHSIDPLLDILYSPIKNIDITKSSCVIKDSINGVNNPKRIPNATLRYTFEITYRGGIDATDVIINDKLSDKFDFSTIKHLQIQDGICDCLGVTSTDNNGVNGSDDGTNPVKLDFGTVRLGSITNPTKECGYFEVNIK